ncbi:MAG: AAA family ATPase [Aurantimonas endophytica]|uniref:AAA family ATPase n=1 Tax=Aurantimonas endophytica TaxID=1522175 RepID=UPI0030012583
MLHPVLNAPEPASGERFDAHPPRPSSGLLARRFVDMLLADAGKGSAGVQNPGQADPDTFGGLAEFDLPLEAEQEEDLGSPTLSVNGAAAAILLAASFEADPVVLRALRRDAPVVVIELSGNGLEEATDEALRVCVFGRAVAILGGGGRYVTLQTTPRSHRRSAVVLSCDVSKGERARLEEQTLIALSLGLPVCALSTDPIRAVPDALRNIADHTIRPVAWSGVMLSILIEAVTGSAIEVPDDEWIGRLSIADLRMSVSHRRGAAGSLDRLRAVAARRSAHADDLPRLEDLSGYGEARTIGLAMIEDLHAYRDGKIPWSDVDRGLLVAGPPGVGKTLFARVLARSAGLPLVVSSLAQWQSSGTGHLGDCLAAMKKSFREARGLAPVILFIDELDSIGDRATFDARHRDYSTQVVNGLLEELDGATDRSGVIVIGATNHVHRIDAAVLRSGRLDRVVRIDLPSPQDLVGILRTYLGPLLPDADLLPAALAGHGGSGADAAAWVRRARGAARRAGRDMTTSDLLESVRGGRAGLPADIRHRVAMHEAGHACATIALGLGEVHALMVHDVGGAALISSPPSVTTRDRALRQIVHLLAGRAAEILATGIPSAGAGGSSDSDLALATSIAVAIEGSWGIGESGPLWVGDPANGLGTVLAVHSLAPAVRRILHHCEVEAERLVRENFQAVRRCADILVDAGYLEADRVVEALGPVPPFAIAVDMMGAAPAGAGD